MGFWNWWDIPFHRSCYAVACNESFSHTTAYVSENVSEKHVETSGCNVICGEPDHEHNVILSLRGSKNVIDSILL